MPPRPPPAHRDGWALVRVADGDALYRALHSALMTGDTRADGGRSGAGPPSARPPSGPLPPLEQQLEAVQRGLPPKSVAQF
eukprot:gene13485-6196_t